MKSARAAAFRALHPDFRPLGDFIEEATVIVRPADEPEKLWPVYGVNNRVGVVLSHHQPGAEFNAPYKHIERDWFFHNPTRANVGSLGRVPEVPPDALTSPEYQVWRIRHGLLPDFVEILIRLPFFLDLVECHRVGAVKERLFVENLKEIPIPLLSEAEQRGIVERWRKEQTKVITARQRADVNHEQSRDAFNVALGIEDTGRAITAKAFCLRWQEVGRWSVGYIRKASAGLVPISDCFPVVRLADVVSDLVNGWSPQCFERPAELDEWGVLKLGAVSFGEFDENENKALPTNMQSISELEIQVGDVLISRANVARLVGACAVVRQTRPRLLLCDKIFRAVFRPDSPVDPEFLAEVLKIPHLRRQIECAITGSSATMQNITKEALLDLRFPLPSLPEQRELVERVAAARAEIVRERAEADRLAAAIAAETEALLLGTRRIEN